MKKYIVSTVAFMALAINAFGVDGDFVDPNLGISKINMWASVCPNNKADLATVWVPWRTRTLGFLMGNEA
ncbi:MAG: hypothetical protein WC673_02805, partial [Candidatus Paceibacterota bacterium]